MLNSIKFEYFRGFDNIEFSELRPITIIGGKNNAGKSSVLEGLFLAIDHNSPDSFMKINQFRSLPVISEPRYLWEPLFHNMDTSSELAIHYCIDDANHILVYTKDDTFVPPNDGGMPPEVLGQFIVCIMGLKPSP